MDETAKQILTFLGTAGGSASLLLLGKALAKLWTGAAHRERIRTTSLVTRTENAEKKQEEAEAESDEERKLRIKAEYHVSLLERQVVSLGGEPVKNPKDLKE